MYQLPKLTAEQVKEIRKRYQPTKQIGIKYLAKEYGVSYTTMKRLIKGYSYQSVT